MIGMRLLVVKSNCTVSVLNLADYLGKWVLCLDVSKFRISNGCTLASQAMVLYPRLGIVGNLPGIVQQGTHLTVCLNNLRSISILGKLCIGVLPALDISVKEYLLKLFFTLLELRVIL